MLRCGYILKVELTALTARLQKGREKQRQRQKEREESEEWLQDL